MRSIKARFKIMGNKYPSASSYICFGRAIKEQGFSRLSIMEWFNNLVDHDDYFLEEKKALIRYLCSISRPLEEHRNQGKRRQYE